MLENTVTFVGFEILTAIATKTSILWDVTSCGTVKVNTRFGGTYRLHLQSQRVNQTKHQAGSMHRSSFLAWFAFNPEDGSDIFLRYVG
jgi:hypothetical protein